jgi:phosphate starvation-inducible PhoH-like protein
MVKETKRNNNEQQLNKKKFNSLKEIRARNVNQSRYLDSIENNVVTLGLGPAGSGKTYLAVYEALLHNWTKSKKMKRLIITRPAVEAGEKLGFLPGDLNDKLHPYMRPIYDALYDIVNGDSVAIVNEKIERGYIEIAPLAYMRGRTFNDCFIILDEAQNATLEQLKMVLTRIGDNCKLVIDGDPGQTDLPDYKKKSGLHDLKYILDGVDNVGIIEFESEDIVRNPIVMDVVKAFQEYERNKKEG